MDDTAARRILGVAPNASPKQARDAYKRRAKLVHPDRYAQASPSERRAAERAMAELNEAWRTVKHGPPDRHAITAPQAPAPARPEPARPRGCELCGYLPAVQVDVRSLTGLLIIYWTDRYTGVLCRSCGTALCRDVQAQTLTRGWWGLPAMLVNLAVLVNNGSYFRALREMQWPRERSADAPLTEPMSVTTKVTARPLPWVATVTAAAMVVVVVLLLVLVAP